MTLAYPAITMKYLLAGISLAVLAIGFTLLGLLALINRPQVDLAGVTVLENNCCVIGSIISISAGAIFLIAGRVYWDQSLHIVATQRRKNFRIRQGISTPENSREMSLSDIQRSAARPKFIGVGKPSACSVLNKQGET